MAAIFAVINPLVTLGRAHIDYDAQTNSVVTRFAILVDAATAFYLDKTNSKGDSDPQSLKNISANPTKFTRDVNEMRPMGGRLRALATRFEVISIQGYLINEYNSGRSGKSLADPWAVLVPRALWPDKPILTRFGTELNAQYYFFPGQERPQTNTSIGPTYSAEAYWNYGPLGVVIVSILLGLGLGWFTRCWQQAMAGQDIAFLLIAFPVAIWASFVESWVVATYLGEFIIFVVLLLVARAASSLLRPLKLCGPS